MIVVETTIKAGIGRVWKSWTNPDAIISWNHASEDWHCPKATNDLHVGGKFSYTMAAKDKSSSFDFEGTYSLIDPLKRIQYSMIDGRKVEVQFENIDENTTKVKEMFEMESSHSKEQQSEGWGSILENFRKYCEKGI